MTSRADRNSADYHRIERAIRFLDDSAPTRPSLDQVARHVGMSPFHFQRLFTRWAGISSDSSGLASEPRPPPARAT
jgi:AraC-like DNA-binding protein